MALDGVLSLTTSTGCRRTQAWCPPLDSHLNSRGQAWRVCRPCAVRLLPSVTEWHILTLSACHRGPGTQAQPPPPAPCAHWKVALGPFQAISMETAVLRRHKPLRRIFLRPQPGLTLWLAPLPSQDYGGYLSSYILLSGEENKEQVFSCGAALSPLTDFKLYGKCSLQPAEASGARCPGMHRGCFRCPCLGAGQV